MFLHHVLQQKEDSLIFKFFMAQLNSPTSQDWVVTVLQDIEELDIQLELGSIKDMKKVKFKNIVKEKVKCGAFEYLMDKKAARKSENAKGKLLEYEHLEKSEYLTPLEYDLYI